VGTANFADPCASMKVVAGLAEDCEHHGTSVQDLIGRAREQ